MRKDILSYACMAIFCATEASAQSTNCLNLGGGMVHCDTMGSGSNGSSSTDCMAMGSTMVHCNTMQMPSSEPAPSSSPDGGTALGQGIASLIIKARENSFRKKVGQMMAAGDCRGAANYAYSKGRIEAASTIMRSCIPGNVATAPAVGTGTARAPLGSAPAQPSSLSVSINDRLRSIAAQTHTPMALSNATTLSRVEALGSQLLLTVTVPQPGTPVTEAFRNQITSGVCSDASMTSLLKAGASIRTVYLNPEGHQVGAIMITRQECGF